MTELIRWVPPDPGKLDHERLWLGVGLGTAGLATWWTRSGRPLPPCLFHQLTGWPCPGCGSTRAVLQLAHGHIAQAFTFNPLATVAVLAAVAYGLYAATVVALRLPRLNFGVPPTPWPQILRLACLLAVMANWVWTIRHLT